MDQKCYILIWTSPKFVPKGPIDNKSALVQVMAWRWTGQKPLPEAILIQFTDTCMWHLWEMNELIWWTLVKTRKKWICDIFQHNSRNLHSWLCTESSSHLHLVFISHFIFNITDNPNPSLLTHWPWPHLVQGHTKNINIIFHLVPSRKMICYTDKLFFIELYNGIWSGLTELTHWGPNKMADLLHIYILISLKYVPKGSIIYKSEFVQVMGWLWTGHKPLFEPMMTKH